jgi:hypothetical protein
MATAKKNIDVIIKLQARIRGYLLRKNNKLVRDMQDAKPKSSNRGAIKLPGKFKMVDNKGKPILNGNSFGQELGNMPDYSNTLTNSAEDRMGYF